MKAVILSLYPDFSFQLPPNGAGITQVIGAPDKVQEGYATVVGRTVGGNAVFRWQVQGNADFEASVPITTAVEKLVFPFDNSNGYYMGIALVNTNVDGSFVDLAIRDLAGNVISTHRAFNTAHQSYLLKDVYPETRGIAGTIEFAAFGGDGTPPQATIFGDSPAIQPHRAIHHDDAGVCRQFSVTVSARGRHPRYG
jgi:hypothetical protein